ncbi:MAG: FkbM family methyltransferase [Bacteroidota bacterium]|nr:FkbM family methyltransferase [Bacteroidota bacterium]
MKRSDRIKLDFTRNWKLPGKERLSRLLQPSDKFKKSITDGIVWLGSEDIAIYTSADSYIEYTILSNGTYEDEINKLIRISLKTGGNALDIGGNIGLQSVRMSQCVGPTGKIFAFEPLNYLQQKFKRNMLLNKAANVTLFPYALSNKEGEADFSINPNSWNQGTFSLSNSSGTEVQHVTIKVADDLDEVKALESLDLIKIDVEGFEFQVLLGLAKTLKVHKPRIIFEYDSNYWLNNGQSIADCYSFLESLGYTLYQVTPVGCELLKSSNEVEGGNLFCIPA